MLLMVEDLKNELRKHNVRFHPDSAILVASGYQFDPAKGARITFEADRECLFFSGFGRLRFDELKDITGNDIERFGYDVREFWGTLYPAMKGLIDRIKTPEPEPSPFEFRDQARCILQSHAVEQSVEEAEKTCITEDGFARIYASELVIVIQPEEEVMHISTLEPAKTYTFGFPEWDNLYVHDDESFWMSINYTWWLDHLKPALFEIIELLESPDTSSEVKPDHSPEAPENETVIKLRKQIEELQGRLSEYEKPLKKKAMEWVEKRNHVEDQIRECERDIRKLSQTRDKLRADHDIIQKQIDVFAHGIRKLEQEGVTSDS